MLDRRIILLSDWKDITMVTRVLRTDTKNKAGLWPAKCFFFRLTDLTGPELTLRG
jgi:hypothetical protein